MNGSTPRFARLPTLLLTYAIKLVGLASAFNQLLLQKDPRPLPLAVAAFMMAGAQLSEGMILMYLEKLTGPQPEPKRARRGS